LAILSNTDVKLGKVLSDTERFTDLGNQSKFPDDGLVLGSSQFSILPQLPPKILLNSEVVKIDPKIIISVWYFKFVTHPLCLFSAYW